MKKEVVITITDVQDIDGDTETIELTTAGKFYKKGDVWYLAYEETEATGYEGCTTTLKIEPVGKVTITRFGKTARTQLVVEPGVRHQCLYGTGYGDIMLGVMGSGTQLKLTEDGGEVSFAYSLDVNTSLASHNSVTVQVH
ncbi:MAG: DUF1934 domain-containing protein [Oscillospiraceae bacterium]|nr:DUF1934 domain-containing protein [Oscillospiraceae bacterium]